MNDSDAFWGLSELAWFLALALPCLVVGALLARGLQALFAGMKVHALVPVLVGQFSAYCLLFGGVAVWFRYRYARPFWCSLGWVRPSCGLRTLVLWGELLAVAVALTAMLLRIGGPAAWTDSLRRDREAFALIALFSTTLGPLFEELAFRGLAQPVLVRSLGVIPGILLAGLPYGLFFLAQQGWRWGILNALASVAWGWVRHKTGSTMAAAVMHASFNATVVVGVLLLEIYGGGTGGG